MSNQFIKIENVELENFVKKVKDTDEFKIIVSELIQHKKIDSENFEVVEASRLENSEFKISMLTLVQGETKVVFVDNGTKYKFTLRIIEKRDGIEMAYLYEILDKDLILTNKAKYENILDAMKELDENAIPQTQNINKEEVKANLPCFHGKWCGPKCSGPGDPIDAVDTCCRAHDNCYDDRGSDSCECNRKLKRCLKPYAAEGSQWAIVVIAAFDIWPCQEYAF